MSASIDRSWPREVRLTASKVRLTALAQFFFAASAGKALICHVSRSGIAIFCNILQLSKVSKTGETQLSASFCSKLQAVRALASANGGDQFRPVELAPRVIGILGSYKVSEYGA
jgi:hypothetical protein